MSRERAATGLMIIGSLLFLPGRIVEEGLHVLGAFPWARELSVHIQPESGTAHTRVQFRENTPSWAVRLAYALPELAATITGGIIIAYWLLEGAVWLPSTTLDWLLLSLFGAQFIAIAIPSAADLDHSAEGSG